MVGSPASIIEVGIVRIRGRCTDHSSRLKGSMAQRRLFMIEPRLNGLRESIGQGPPILEFGISKRSTKY
jgi:hypothetical protein